MQLRFFLFSLIGSLSLYIVSCGSTNNLEWNSDHLSVKTAYVQRYVPGEEDATPTSYLFLHVEHSDPAAVLDSIYYDGHMSPANTARVPMKIDWEKGDIQVHIDEIGENQAIIFYTINEKAYKYRVMSVGKKEDLYLP